MQEWQELQEEIIARWTEVHKKSMVMFLIMLALSSKSMWSKELEKWLMETTEWDISERGLHRTLKRMNNLGLVEYEETNAPKTGAKRKNYILSDFGVSTLKKMKEVTLRYWSSDYFIKSLKEI